PDPRNLPTSGEEKHRNPLSETWPATNSMPSMSGCAIHPLVGSPDPPHLGEILTITWSGPSVD
ncbi:MAG: hypothetical protein V3S41_06030, partial [Spirochaetia bacterium]